MASVIRSALVAIYQPCDLAALEVNVRYRGARGFRGSRSDLEVQSLQPHGFSNKRRKQHDLAAAFAD